MITGLLTNRGVVFSSTWPEPCPVEWCQHRHSIDKPCDTVTAYPNRGRCFEREPDQTCGCSPCRSCRGYGVIVVGYDERAKEDVERVCLRCDGGGQA